MTIPLIADTIITMKYKKHPELLLRNYIALPFVFSMIIPLVVLDIFLEIYHNIAFRLYKIPLIKRSDYIRIDRHKLKYLNALDKFSCTYCGYANGLVLYASIIAGETEKYWCGIKHKDNSDDAVFTKDPYHKNFLEYGDEEAYIKISKSKKVN